MKRKVYLLVGVMLMAGCGCTRKIYMPVESSRTVTTVADSMSVFDRLVRLAESRDRSESRADSVTDRTAETVVLNAGGDTVRLTRERFVYVSSVREKELEHAVATRDSVIRDLRSRLYFASVDSVAVPYPVETKVEVKKPPSSLEQFFMATGFITVVWLLVRLVLWIRQRKFC